MIRAVGVLDCFRAHIRLRELGKSEDKAEGKTSTESLIPCSYGGRVLGRKSFAVGLAVVGFCSRFGLVNTGCAVFDLAEYLFPLLQGCVYIVDAYKVYWSSCLKGVHTGQMVLRLVEAIGKVFYMFNSNLVLSLLISNLF
ncbi:hypothetical protein B296_00012757 [Ensete ventricosum]|uniref:Uncharacterized protein n=1 Tax=Ensete ventricosum TaxID=4639 RepID=A0A427B8L1_ENSVE|nr:hypothetical protein B296_00012757 [Ensete ventricosum]